MLPFLAQGSMPEFAFALVDVGPRLTVAVLPTDTEERNDLLFSGAGGRDLQNLPKYFRDFSADGRTVAVQIEEHRGLGSIKDPDNLLGSPFLARANGPITGFGSLAAVDPAATNQQNPVIGPLARAKNGGPTNSPGLYLPRPLCSSIWTATCAHPC